MLDINKIIDLESYPIDRPRSRGYRDLVARGRDALAARALHLLPQFLRAEIVPCMAREVDALFPRALRYDRPRVAYDYEGRSRDWPDDHPERRRHPCAYHQLLNYQIPNDSLLRRVYYWQPLTDFLREVCDYETFFRSDCPHLALTSKIASAGDTDGWHYDTCDVVFSILLQAADAGGQFEYAPYIRSDDDENYIAVEALFDDPQKNARRPRINPGDLTLFKGDRSMHRVTPVEGVRRRIVALFCYDREPGTTFEQAYIEELEQGLPRVS